MEIKIKPWAAREKFAFRFLFSYLLLYIASEMLNNFGRAFSPLWKIRNVLLYDPMNFLAAQLPGFSSPLSTCDGSYHSMMVFFFIFLSLLTAVVWTVLSPAAVTYYNLQYLLHNVIRYFLAVIMITSSFVKLSIAADPYPSLSFLATELGEFMVTGTKIATRIDNSFQTSIALLGILASILLLFRRTLYPGIFLSLAIAFLICLQSIGASAIIQTWGHIILCCLILLAFRAKRFATILFTDQPVHAVQNPVYPPFYIQAVKFAGMGTWILLICFGYFAFNMINRQMRKPFAYGRYHIEYLQLKEGVHPVPDGPGWNDLIFDDHHVISVKSDDARLQQIRGRAYMYYDLSKKSNELQLITYVSTGKIGVGTVRFNQIDNNRLTLEGDIFGSPVRLLLRKK